MAYSPAINLTSAGTTGTQASTTAPGGAAAEKFSESMQRAESGDASGNALLDPFLSLNTHSATLADQAASLETKDMRPSELLLLTMRSHEFLFHCELVSNVANRSSDGVQQLFRQQS